MTDENAAKKSANDPATVAAPELGPHGTPAGGAEKLSHADEPAASHTRPQQSSFDVNVRGIGAFLAGLVACLTVVAGLVYAQMVWLGKRLDEARPAAPFRAAQRLPPPAPVLQDSPSLDMRALRENQEADLRRSAWVDRDKHLMQIPIDRAMKRLVREGLPNWPPAPPESTGGGPSAANASPGAPAGPATPQGSPTPTAPSSLSPRYPGERAGVRGSPSSTATPSSTPPPPTPRPTSSPTPTPKGPALTVPLPGTPAPSSPAPTGSPTPTKPAERQP